MKLGTLFGMVINPAFAGKVAARTVAKKAQAALDQAKEDAATELEEQLQRIKQHPEDILGSEYATPEAYELSAMAKARQQEASASIWETKAKQEKQKQLIKTIIIVTVIIIAIVILLLYIRAWMKRSGKSIGSFFTVSRP